MKCPNCGSLDDKVLESRQIAGGASIRRRRMCNACEYRFTSYEHIEEKTLAVVKKDNRREEFSHEKLARGIQKACEKRPIASSEISQAVIDIYDKVVFMAGDQHEIKSIDLGEVTMKKLKQLDLVAFIRYASVYKQFDDVKEFIKEINCIDI